MSLHMKLIKAKFPVGEGILWITAIFECLGLIALYPVSCPRSLILRSMNKISAAISKLYFVPIK